MADRIRVLQLIPTLDGYGAEKQMTLLACGLPRDQFEVHVAVLTRTGPYEARLRAAGVPVCFLHKRLKFDPFALWRLKRLLDRWQPDILHTWLFAANSYGRLVAGGRDRPRVIVSERCVDVWKAGWQRWLDRRLIERTHRLVANSASVARFYRDLGMPEPRLVVIRNAVEVPDDSGQPLPAAQRQRLLAHLGFPQDAKVVGYVGRIARQKRVDDLIWAAELLRRIDDRAWFLIAGDGPERDKMQRFAEQVGVAERIRFLGHRDDVPQLLRLIDVFWQASDFEGLSNSVMEAMAAARPVVVSDIAPNRELVSDGETGLIVPVGDRLGFAKAAAGLLADPERAGRLGQAAQQRMKADFSVSRMIDAHAELYREQKTELTR
ncbi:MAG: glycosyltransferase [Planctomycetes bacterium]|nr:glycosyltransferase [Planctomycetota bacterium]